MADAYYSWRMRFQAPLAVVTPSLDGDVLYVLARAETWFTAPRLTHQLNDRSVEGVRRVLSRLVAEGVVERESSSHTPLYRLNKEHLAAPAIVELANLREKLITRMGETMQAWSHPPRYAALFGSAVGGAMRPDSDLDLFLVRPHDADGSWSDDVAALAATASRWTGNDVRPLEYGEAEIEGGDDPVLRDIEQSGITLSGDRAWFRRALAKR